MPTPPPHAPRRRAHALAALLLAAMAVLLELDLRRDSPTIDEKNHLVRGLAALTTGDLRLSSSHPPLANLLQALPGALRGASLDLSRAPGWDRAAVDPVARAWLAHDYERARGDIMAGRRVTLLLALALGLGLYLGALARGPTFALLVLALYALHPIVLAHGHLATTDLPITAAAVLVAFAAARCLERRGPAPLVALGLALGLAFATKLSALLLLPGLALAAAWTAARGLGRYAGPAPARRALLLARDVLAAAALAVLVVNAAYGFQRTGWRVDALLAEPEPERALTTARYHGALLDQRSPLRHLPGWLRVPLPYPYVFGLSAVEAQAADGHGNHLFGRTWAWMPAYFPALLLLKTSLGLLALFGLGLALARPRLPTSPRALVFVALPLGWLLLAMSARLNVGVRHVLPVVPFMILLAARGAERLLAHDRPAARRLALGLLGLTAAEAIAATPDHLSHFSWLVGGDGPGHRLNVVGEDWAQDVARLGDHVRDHDLGLLYYDAYGDAAEHELRRTGVAYERLRCDADLVRPAVIARHASELVRRPPRACGPIAADRPPDLEVAHHIRLWLVR